MSVRTRIRDWLNRQSTAEITSSAVESMIETAVERAVRKAFARESKMKCEAMARAERDRSLARMIDQLRAGKPASAPPAPRTETQSPLADGPSPAGGQ